MSTTSQTVGVGEDDLVTGEAVAIDLPPASIGPRILAGVIDYVLVAGLTVGVFTLAAALTAQVDDALASAVVLVCTVLVLVAVPIAFETVTRGRTPGKMAVGLRAVRDDGGPISFRHALARGLLRYLEVYLFYGVPAVISCVVSKRGKRIGDLVAGTYVVRDRVTAQLAPPLPMPPQLAHWAWNADIGALPDQLAMAIRTFLPAAATMTPEARETMGCSLLKEVALYVSPPPPPGNHQEYVLAAVVADRRRRDLERLRRDDALRRRLLVPDPLSPTPWR
ncbi:MAG: RDD family protein [Actinomycetota bacterium]|nr:RDD family protein [Actinomycetota bacterium]